MSQRAYIPNRASASLAEQRLRSVGALMICRALRKGGLEFLPFKPLILKSFDTSNCQKPLSNNFVSIHVSFTASS